VQLVATEPSDSNELVEKAVRSIRNKADALGLDVEVSRIASASDQLSVKYYGDSSLAAVRGTLLTVYRLQLNKVVGGGGVLPAVYESEDRARASLKEGQKVLPVKKDFDSQSQRFLIVENETIIDGSGVRSASVNERGAGNYSIAFSLTPTAAVKFGDWTGRNIQNYLAIVINDEVQSYPVIKGQIFDSGQIEGRFSKHEAEDIATSLNSGYIPAKMTIISERPFKD
jgi:preprotein translocase subunit SecD